MGHCIKAWRPSSVSLQVFVHFKGIKTKEVLNAYIELRKPWIKRLFILEGWMEELPNHSRIAGRVIKGYLHKSLPWRLLPERHEMVRRKLAFLLNEQLLRDFLTKQDYPLISVNELLGITKQQKCLLHKQIEDLHDATLNS